jgi:myo-inositol-1(or 4)-monophosphatase
MAAIPALEARGEARFKGAGLDVVTDADLAAEAAAIALLAQLRPDDGVVGEEGGERPGTSGVVWLIDPIDSTANYARGIPLYSVSVAARDPNGVVAAAVGDPERDAVFSTFRTAGGIRLNGIAVERPESPPAQRALAIFGMGMRSRPEHPRHSLVATTLFGTFGKVRSPGSPALGLAWTAAGLADVAYYEQDFNDWDVAAGSLLCSEAGLGVAFLGPAAAGLSPRLAAGGALMDSLGPLLD